MRNLKRFDFSKTLVLLAILSTACGAHATPDQAVAPAATTVATLISAPGEAVSPGGIILPKPPKILRPDPNSFSELGAFTPSWCAPNEVSTSPETLCFGRSVFKNMQPVRSVALTTGAATEIYVESNWPNVELLNLRFEVIGPINQPSVYESGVLLLEIDEKGEVVGVSGQTPRHGYFKAQSPRGF